MKNTKLLENTARFRKTKRGLVTNLFSKIKTRNTVDFDLSWLHEFSQCKKFDRIFNEWVKSKYNKQFKPSLDRINNKIGYTKTNVQWLTWAENRFKQSMERRHRSPMVAQKMGDKIIKIYKSQLDAVRKTGLSQGNLSMALTGKRKLCGGYSWEYVFDNPELLTP